MSAHLSGSYEELAMQARNHLQSNQFEQAEAIYERIYQRLSKMKVELVDRRPRLKELKIISLRSLGDIAGLNNNYDQAITYYQQALALDPDQALQYQRAIAQSKIDQGEVEAGLDELRVLAVTNAGLAEPWLWLGIELWSQGNNQEAVESLKRAAEMPPGQDAQTQSAAYSYLHDVYREEDNLEAATDAWEQAWKIGGGEIEDVSPLYQMYFEAGDLAQARSWLAKEKNPLRAGFYRGLFAQAEGADKKAQSAWQKTTQLNPLEQTDGHEAWAEAALRANMPPDAVSYIMQEVNARNLGNIRGAILLAVALVRAGRLDGAEAALKGALDISRRARPPQEQLSAGLWELFAELVTDEAAKAQFRDYFAPEPAESPTEATEPEPVDAADTAE